MAGEAAVTDLTIELCGKLAERAGRELAVAMPTAGFTVAALRQHIALTVPALAAEITSARVRACVNEAIVEDDMLLAPCDRIAFFPPVSGG